MPGCGMTVTDHHANRRRLTSGTRPAARGKRSIKETRGPRATLSEGERKGSTFGLRAGPFSGDLISRTMGEAAGHERPDPGVHPGKRSAAQEEGITRRGPMNEHRRPRTLPPAVALGILGLVLV